MKKDNNEKLIKKTYQRLVDDDLFIKRLEEYKAIHGNFDGVTQDELIGAKVCYVRQAYKGKSAKTLHPSIIDKLNAIGFPWVVDKKDWFTPFYEKLIEYKDRVIYNKSGSIRKPKGSFYGLSTDKEIGIIVRNVREAYKGNHTIKLTKEMIDKLNEIDFPWEGAKKDTVEDNISL